MPFTPPLKQLSDFSWLMGWCALIPNPITGYCQVMAATITILQINRELSVTQDPRYGIVRQIRLHVSSFAGSTGDRNCDDGDNPAQVGALALTGQRRDRVCQTGLIRQHEKFNLHLNNADNSVDIPSSKAKNITGATLGISHKTDWLQISDSIKGVVSQLTGVSLPPSGSKLLNLFISQVTDKLVTLLAIKIDLQLNPPTDFKEISPKYIASDVTSFLIPNFTTSNCDLKADVNHYYVNTSANRVFRVPDVFPSLAYGEIPQVGTCDFKIQDDYLLPSEEDIYSQINFHLKNYPRLNLTKQSAGSVHYGFKTVSGAMDCQKETCTEFLDLGKSLYFWLSAYTEDTQNGSQPSYVTWIRNGNTECDTADCKFNLDFNINNDPPLNIDVSFTSNYDAGFTEVLYENIGDSFYYQCPPSETGEITSTGHYRDLPGSPNIVYGEPKFSIKNLLFDPDKIYFQIPWDERLSNTSVYDFSGDYINNDPKSIKATAYAQAPLIVHQLSGPGCDGVITIGETTDIYLMIEGRFNSDGSFVGFMDMKKSTVWDVNPGQVQVTTHDGKYAVLAKPRLISATQ